MATAEQLTSRCVIDIVGVDLAAGEQDFLVTVLARAAQHVHAARFIHIHCSERLASGWLEWTIQISYKREGNLTIGAIQRTAGAEVEFHS
jgi:hypothetical protein